MSSGAPVAGTDFGYVSNLVIVVVSFPCSLNQGAAQLTAKEAHVITKGMRNAGNGGSPSFFPSGELLILKADQKKNPKQTKKSNDYDSLRRAKF